MGDTIKTRKGSKAALDADPLLLAELGFVTDEERVYIGGNTGNIPLPNAADLSEKVNPNLLINGDFQVWQRGASVNSGVTNKYCADRWTFFDGKNVITATQVDNGITLTRTSVDLTSLMFLSQTIEVPKSLWGKKVTFSYEGPLVKLNIHFNNTVKNGLSGTTSYTPTNSTTKTITATIPSGTLSLSVNLFADTLTTLTINWVKLELGSIATPFVPRLYGEELALCQRYYNSFSSLSFQLLAIQDGGGNYRATGMVNFPKMRIAPTVTINSLSGTKNKVTVGDSEIYSIDPANIDSSLSALKSALIDTLFVTALHSAVYHYFKFNATLDSEIY